MITNLSNSLIPKKTSSEGTLDGFYIYKNTIFFVQTQGGKHNDVAAALSRRVHLLTIVKADVSN